MCCIWTCMLYKTLHTVHRVKGLLHGYEWSFRFDGLKLRFWLKNTSEHNERFFFFFFFFTKTSTRVHQILTSTNYHEVTHFSHEKFNIFPIMAVSHFLLCMRARASRHVHAMCAWCTLSKRHHVCVVYTMFYHWRNSKQLPSNIPQAQPRRIEICESRLFWE